MNPLVDQSVQATAYAAAACRAAESRRPNPRLSDPFAELFAPSGADAQVARLADAGVDEVVGRTVLIDKMLVAALDRWPGAAVVNLGAGFCTRPYRLDLSGFRELVEADDPAVVELKTRVLRGRQPSCPVRRVGLDVRDETALTAVLDEAGHSGAVIVVTEGLLVYLPAVAVTALAGTLARRPAVVHWLADIVSEGSAKQMQAIAQRVPGGLALFGIDSLAPLEAPGWQVVGYRALPVSRPRYGPATGTSSRALVDGVVALDRHHHGTMAG
ncbi:class I SAM-dependent methyltransferase [Phytohabitans flavus]|uniref:Putative S-adenosyl-L-methionine-dependent methyltransferase n=1 Tax=Phytohabitans flavus TaxID=1076124 RepID=A0A6F8XNZ7_9ACTN|nr:class I SAM-dependent methyltransferase [Phytohabitans flavus]BCB75555.1 putative S-adenosyl-L-methionine-dependent methyltransferase [Phytohabitans flavus]